MRRDSRLTAFLQARWLEVALLVLLGVIVFWYTNVGLGFVPKPTPTPTPVPTPIPTVTPAPPPPSQTPGPAGQAFDGNRAFADVLAQMQFGPRPTGSEGNRLTQEYITKVLRENGWQVENQDFNYMNTSGRNIV